MNEQHVEQTLNRATLSALMDGELDLPAARAALSTLKGESDHACWHVYHVIGDVLRSDELADCTADRAFLQRLSGRLAAESAPPVAPSLPVVDATQVAASERPAANESVFRWKLVAGLSSFAAVAAVGWGLMGGMGLQPAPSSAQMAQVQRPTALTLASFGGAVEQDGAALPASDNAGTMLRDPALDELMAAHRQVAGVSALGNASGFLRNATFEGGGR